MVFSDKFKDFTLGLPKQKSTLAPEYIWSNAGRALFTLILGAARAFTISNLIPADQDPVPVNKRTWTRSIFVLYWFSDLITVAGWGAAASVVAVGLTASDAIWITLVASLCNAIPTGKNSEWSSDLAELRRSPNSA